MRKLKRKVKKAIKKTKKKDKKAKKVKAKKPKTKKQLVKKVKKLTWMQKIKRAIMRKEKVWKVKRMMKKLGNVKGNVRFWRKMSKMISTKNWNQVLGLIEIVLVFFGKSLGLLFSIFEFILIICVMHRHSNPFVFSSTMVIGIVFSPII